MGEAHTEFTVELFNAVAAPAPGSVVLSPHGVAVVLSMVLAGARGHTAEELRAVLHDMDPAALAGLERTLRSRAEAVPDGSLALELAASEWLDVQAALLPDYRRTIEDVFGAVPHVVDFANDSPAATEAINADVAEQTHGRIPRLLPWPLDPATWLVLVSTAYLKARWGQPFRPHLTEPRPFHLPDGSQADRPTMRREGRFAEGRGDGWRAVRLPYLGGLSMLVVVPDDLAAFSSELNAEALAAVNEGTARQALLDLTMPSFEFRTTGSLRPALESLGMRSAFTAGADLRGISAGPPLNVSDVVQEAWIQVDEHGTEAAAATAAMVVATSAIVRTQDPEPFAVDRPFLFVIADDATGAVLFIGRVLDPAG